LASSSTRDKPAVRDDEPGTTRYDAASAKRDGNSSAIRDGEQAVPETPADLGSGSWLAAAKRSVREFQDDALTDRAATLTYYGVLAIFPGILFLVSLLGLLGRQATQPLINNFAAAVPGAVRQTMLSAVNHLQGGHATASLVAIVGLAAALWSSSSYTAAFMRASNAIYDVPEGRPIWKTLPIRLGVTLVLMVLLVASALMVVVTGGLAARVGHVLGIGSTAVAIWDIAKWPVLLILVSLMLALLYWASPNAKHGFRWGKPGRPAGSDQLAARLGPFHALRRVLRALQQDLRHPRRGHHLLCLALDIQHRRTVRRRVQRRTGAGARDGRRRARADRPAVRHRLPEIFTVGHGRDLDPHAGSAVSVRAGHAVGEAFARPSRTAPATGLAEVVSPLGIPLPEACSW
jgi:membrane protein